MREARLGTAAYWIEVFNEQAERERALRRGREEAPPPDAAPPPALEDEKTPKLS